MLLTPVLERRMSLLAIEEYRYDIDGAKLVFTQDMKTGFIDDVQVILPDAYEGFHITAFPRDYLIGYYGCCNIQLPRTVFPGDDAKKCLERFIMVNNIAETVDELFKNSEHHDLYIAAEKRLSENKSVEV